MERHGGLFHPSSALVRLSHKPSRHPANDRDPSKISHRHGSQEPRHCWLSATCEAVVLGGWDSGTADRANRRAFGRTNRTQDFGRTNPIRENWQNEPNFPPVSPSHRDKRGMTSFHVPLPRGWNAERTRQLIAVYRFSRSSGESLVVPAGAGVDRFPGGGPFVRLPS